MKANGQIHVQGETSPASIAQEIKCLAFVQRTVLNDLLLIKHSLIMFYFIRSYSSLFYVNSY